MTGYAAHTRDFGRGVLSLELRSVNSRFLDLAFRAPDELRGMEPQLREMFGTRLSRGKVECRINLLPAQDAQGAVSLNLALLGKLRAWQEAVRGALPEATALSVADVLRWPGMLGDETFPPETLQRECHVLAQAVLDDLVASRAREGEKLAAMLVGRVTRMRELVAQAEPALPRVLAEYQDKLATRLREALATADEERIRQEVGMFAARIDVAEELSRLCTHLDEVSRVIGHGGTAGKRLDFLMQELNREANTLASKSVSTEISSIAVELKLLVEQMREQVQNIE